MQNKMNQISKEIEGICFLFDERYLLKYEELLF